MSRAAVADPLKIWSKVMRTLGYITAIALAAAGTALGLQVVKSLPELRRYLAIRKM
jgi:hypothetical protein